MTKVPSTMAALRVLDFINGGGGKVHDGNHAAGEELDAANVLKGHAELRQQAEHDIKAEDEGVERLKVEVLRGHGNGDGDIARGQHGCLGNEGGDAGVIENGSIGLCSVAARRGEATTWDVMSQGGRWHTVVGAAVVVVV
jgi:hypothetical protein